MLLKIASVFIFMMVFGIGFTFLGAKSKYETKEDGSPSTWVSFWMGTGCLGTVGLVVMIILLFIFE